MIDPISSGRRDLAAFLTGRPVNRIIVIEQNPLRPTPDRRGESFLSNSDINLTVKPAEFFREKVSNAATQLNLRIDEHLEFYVVNLLCEFIDPSRLTLENEQLQILETPLAIFLQKALEAPPERQAKIFKRLADSSLYMAGYFQEHFNRKTVHIDYYISLGSAAYNALAKLTAGETRESRRGHLYARLARRFPELVDIVAEVSEIPGAKKPTDILALYDRWTRYPSDRLQRLLSDLGILPVPTPMKQAQ
jgi:hypothetical protein